MIERLEDLADSVELLQAQIENEPMMPFKEHLSMSEESKPDSEN
jgi:hypothetical protein